ncbi:di-trans,poly-cis-decaprenylcistransferase [Sulfurimonas sp. HSL3-7]|uniref:di-trans,poly-cis-decaprenylcistransferase n=1 Tax=Sulfonitrofixus jiaomeiensis TaxID=3131938 RepID=UPI0031F9046C
MSLNTPRHIAIIMDGNGRWAQMQGMKRVKGHEAGAEVVRNVTKYCANHKEIERLTLYAFSTENWKRPKLEVEFLMKLLDRYLQKELSTYMENNIRFQPIGDLSGFSRPLLTTIETVEEKTKHNNGLVQSLALNYGAKDELVRAVNTLVNNKIKVTETTLNDALDCPQQVDLLIRTGGDHRLSNYLLWQAAYAELFFTNTLWPDFSTTELETVIQQFMTIERRFGGLK